MPVLTGRHLRICLLLLGLFLLADYAISPTRKRSSLRGFFASHSSPSTNGPHYGSEIRPLRIEWGDDPIPETQVLFHKIPGWTVFRNLYASSDTIYIVTSHPERIPPKRLMISNGLILALQEENEPTNKTMSIISPNEAKTLFGTSAGFLDGLTFMQTDSPQFIGHMYHFLVEIFALGHWRTYTSPDLDPIFGSLRAFPRRFIVPRATQQEWQDRAGMNQWVMRAGLGSLSFEYKDDWDHRMSLQRPFLLETVILGDRAAWHRGPSLKSPTTEFPMAVKDMWWEPIRQSVVAFALPPGQKSRTSRSKPVITYISRQKTGRRLRDADHDALVLELYRLGRDHGYEVNIPMMEDLDKSSQVTLLGRTTILVGVHGNGLSGQLWLKPSPRTTVIELFIDKGFTYDYEYTARSLGLKHYGFWNDHYFTAPDLPPINYPQGFHDRHITCNASAIAAFIHRRLTLDDPSQA
ncbi:hypothetical protein M408DRAFT_20780 [Serendipita vermifera MAFF 305830]|uniref:Glycosyltransferase family 61 protein n=1 Tax=Serendipita vermifera MAFF 305830 TaxID=933852 RepID=A0A0C3B6P4_SERVB|nr:hypothetical protein M408DRAFT_20780 [Serendipita vermifera MAFF 305830]